MPGKAPVHTRIIGVGNPLRGDDGLGPKAIECLLKEPLSKGVDAIDAGTGGLTLLGLFEGVEKAVLVDAIDSGQPPGSIIRLTPEDAQMIFQEHPLSAHTEGIPLALELGRSLGLLPQVVIFGIQPENVDLGLSLSASVQKNLPELLRQIRRETAA